MANSNKEEKENSPSKRQYNTIVPIIVALIAMVGGIYGKRMDLKIQKSDEAHEKKMKELENAYEQEILMSEQVVTRAEIKYREYEISTKPAINGFHIRPYVYVIMKQSEEKIYIPVEGQFLQAEYAADSNGRCILYREDTTDDLLDLLKEQGYDAQLECMLAMEYTVDEKAQVKAYTFRTGQLVVATEEEILAVLEAWEHLEDVKIDMTFWPIRREEQLKEILETIR